MGRKYVEFEDLTTNMLAKLNDAWPGFNVSVDNFVSNGTDVCAFCTFTADGGLSGKGIHHFVVKDGLEISFDLFWDGGYWAKHSKNLNCLISFKFQSAPSAQPLSVRRQGFWNH